MHNKKQQLYLFAQIISAQPGHYALDLHGERDTADLDIHQKLMVHPEPVIAWAIEFERNELDPVSYVTPICQAQLSSLYEGAILRPDGTVQIRGVEGYASFEDYCATIDERDDTVFSAAYSKREAANAHAQ